MIKLIVTDLDNTIRKIVSIGDMAWRDLRNPV
jgi:hypothetical protein